MKVKLINDGTHNCNFCNKDDYDNFISFSGEGHGPQLSVDMCNNCLIELNYIINNKPLITNESNTNTG